MITDVDTGASTSRTWVREAVTTTVSPKLASGSVMRGTSTAASPTTTSSTVACEKPVSDTVIEYVPAATSASTNSPLPSA